MAGFSDLSAGDKLLIVSLPYRVGIWISNSDDNENTKYDDNIELKELEATLSRLSVQTKQKFAGNIAKQTVNAKKLWRDWYGKSDEASVLEDLSNVLAGAADKISPEHLSEYKKMLWHIALSVASSFGEHIDPDHEMHMDRLVGKLFGGKHKKSKENVSDTEKVALKKLQAVLKA